MKNAIALVGAVMLLVSVAGHADNSQQQKMTDCNAQAKTQNLSGDARKSFMKTCLSNQPAAADAKPLNSQQQKMKQCNADATSKGLSGDARKSFMSSCLKGT